MWRRLKVQAAHGAHVTGIGVVVLHKVIGNALGGKGLFVPDFGKPAARIAKAAGGQDQNAGKRGFIDLHDNLYAII